MIVETSRKVEVLAAVLYAASFVFWTLGNDYEFFEPEFGPGQGVAAFDYEIRWASTVSTWEASCLALLLVAAALTMAAVRLRRSSPQGS